MAITAQNYANIELYVYTDLKRILILKYDHNDPLAVKFRRKSLSYHGRCSILQYKQFSFAF